VKFFRQISFSFPRPQFLRGAGEREENRGADQVEKRAAQKQRSLQSRVKGKNNSLRGGSRERHHSLKRTLSGSDSRVGTRTWQNALDALIETKHGPTKDRWIRARRTIAAGDG